MTRFVRIPPTRRLPDVAQQDSLSLDFVSLLNVEFNLSPAFLGRPRRPEEFPSIGYDYKFQEDLRQHEGRSLLNEIVTVTVVFSDKAGNPLKDPSLRPFDLTASVLGHFTFGEDVSRDRSEALLSTACAILFPYVRELVTNLTARTVYPVARIPPTNVIAIRERQLAAIKPAD